MWDSSVSFTLLDIRSSFQMEEGITGSAEAVCKTILVSIAVACE